MSGAVADQPHTQALVISEENAARCAAVVKYAEAHRIDGAGLRAICARRRRPVGDDPGHIANLDDGVRCVFSIEEHPGGWARHLSITVRGHLPIPALAGVIMQWFGFRGAVDSPVVAAWPEDCPLGRAANLVEMIGH
ncbi:MAG: hypothetical protein SF182_01550 [Deltaproteobacteria bacterium]|nr:hypothetical protein [Deltaproteobacteria bacterium]